MPCAARQVDAPHVILSWALSGGAACGRLQLARPVHLRTRRMESRQREISGCKSFSA